MLLVLQCRKKIIHILVCALEIMPMMATDWEKSTDLLDNPWMAGQMGFWGNFSVPKDSTKMLKS